MENNYISQLAEDFNTFVNQNLAPKDVAGMDIHTGKWLSLNKHIGQQVQDLILTPLGTPIMYPDYGSSAIYYIDMPIVDIVIDLKIEIKKSIEQYENRIEVINMSINLAEFAGQLNLNIEYINSITGEVNSINV